MTCIWRWLVRMFVTVVGGTVFDVTKQMHVSLQINSSFMHIVRKISIQKDSFSQDDFFVASLLLKIIDRFKITCTGISYLYASVQSFKKGEEIMAPCFLQCFTEQWYRNHVLKSICASSFGLNLRINGNTIRFCQF